jgi:uncharacterized protein YdhG (YjbR/CyaY superfamily)
MPVGGYRIKRLDSRRSVLECLAPPFSHVPKEQRAALEKVRKTILSAAPGAEETIAYQMPAVRVDGRLVVSYAAFKDHCSLFPMSYRALRENADALKPYLAEKSTLHFTPDKPIPAALVRKIVKARLEENAAARKRTRGA